MKARLAFWYAVFVATAMQPDATAAIDVSAADSVEAAAAAQAGDAVAAPVPFRYSRFEGVGVVVVAGARRMIDARVGAANFSLRLRRVDDATAGYVRIAAGPMRLLLGRVRLRGGQDVLVGRTFAGLPPARGRSSSLFEFVPTGSLWYGSHAAVANLDAGSWRWTAAAVAAPEAMVTPALRPTAWFSVQRTGSQHLLGTAVACNPSGRLRAATAFLAARKHDVDVAVEAAVVPGRPWFAAVRMAPAEAGLVVRLFRMPEQAAAAHEVSPASDRVMTGASVAARFSVAALRIEGALSAADRASPQQRRKTHVARLGVRRLARIVSWRCEVMLVDDLTLSAPAGALLEQVSRSAYRRLTLRAEVRTRATGALQHFVRVARSDQTDGSSGVVLSGGSAVHVERLSLDWRVSAYVLDRGLRGYVSRPGVAGFEFVSAVFGHGGDAAARLRLQVQRRLRFSVLVASGGSRGARAYLAVEIAP